MFGLTLRIDQSYDAIWVISFAIGSLKFDVYLYRIYIY